DTGSQSSLLKLLAPQLSFLPRMGQAMRCQVNALSLEAAPTPLPSDESQTESGPESEPRSEPESEPEEPSGARMPGLSTGIAIAQLPGHLAVASEPAALQKLIDAQARTPLAQNPQFQRTLKHAQFERSLTVGYGEYTGLLKLANQFFAQLPPIPDPEGKNVRPQKLFSAKQIDYLTQNYSTFDLLTWVRPEGLHSQSNAYFTGLKPEKATPNFSDANQILTRLPAATFVSANSRNFKQQWQEFVEFSQGDKESQDALKLLRDNVRKMTGLDLDQDLIAWMDQQYAVFFFPTKGGFFNAINPQINIGYALLIQTSDRPAAEAALKKIDQLVKKEARGGISIANRRIKGQLMTSWEAKDGKRSISLLSHHWISNDTLMLTSGTGAAADLTPKPFVPLNLTYTFKTATNPFPLPSQGYFYLNMGSTLAFVNTLVRAFEPEIVESPYYQTGLSIIGTIRSISSSQTMTDDRLQADSLWVLGARRQASTVSQPEPPEPSNSSDQTP
ncbi:DUF3352 domain-containing protein, partial [Leptolyngbya sp. FACHB-36]|uniref:DUF3352 domain-containing protein n=1 Tax=Leptolyngbya sp. FACHB-36 TaxID=2692808 RepID=UPI001A7E47E3